MSAFYVLTSGSPTQATHPGITICEDRARTKLLAPTTARFDDPRINQNGRYTEIIGTLTSANVFNVPIQHGYSCTLESNGDGWKIVDFTFHDTLN